MKILKEIALFPLRAVVFAVGLFLYWMEVASDWVIGARRKTEYVRRGKCKKCGKCCQMIALVLPKSLKAESFIVRMFSVWHRLAMNFIPEGSDETALYYRCAYLRERADGLAPVCTVYPFRHRLCRFFPRQQLYGRPSVHDGCGFYFVKRELFNESKKLKKPCDSSFNEVMSKLNSNSNSN